MKGKQNNVQKVLAGMIAVSLLLTACGGTSGGSTATKVPSATGETGKTKSELKPYELTVAYYKIGNIKDQQEVQDAVNKITKEKINATVKFVPIDPAAYQQQINLMLASNENLDLLVTLTGLGYGTQAAKGQLVPLEDLLKKYGSDIAKVVTPEIQKATTTSGKLYGVPSVRDWASDYGILMRKDIVDKYKIDLSKIKTFDDLDPVFKIVKDNEPNMAAIIPEGAGFSIIQTIAPGFMDPLNDDNGVLPGHDNNLKVVNWFESKQYADLLKMVRRWYLAGFIPKDIATNKVRPEDLVKAGKAFAFVAHMKPGYETKEAISTGTPMVAARIISPVTSTSSIANVMFSIAKNSKDPERAMMFLNLIYSDKDLINLIDYGIEGKHYVKKGDLIGFPNGVDAQNATYSPNHGWEWGNQFLSYVWDNDEPNVWKNQEEFNKSSKKSKALGFSFTVDPVKTEVAAVQSVKDQFKIGLETGTLDPDKNLPEFISKLKDSGIDKILAEKQKQLDVWAKNNK
ncbi:ABC transporter substrate-binding protein [Paenibacillus sp. N3.4]|uniref:ABC transporter substrate-binding protein n=1 Tax=Paenibacillus sp. N3.4 TaxID=2603222 RepID=UPI0011C721CF|nr:ABC transporter substrate-binding protein [Paenibacillus sp. N3.4]TXK86000.1 ABC transporter substrate-binding protein [Paenibacillus sp. N3.4]